MITGTILSCAILKHFKNNAISQMRMEIKSLSNTSENINLIEGKSNRYLPKSIKADAHSVFASSVPISRKPETFINLRFACLTTSIMSDWVKAKAKYTT